MNGKLSFLRASRDLGISRDKAKQLYQIFKEEFPFDEPASPADLLGVCE